MVACAEHLPFEQLARDVVPTLRLAFADPIANVRLVAARAVKTLLSIPAFVPKRDFLKDLLIKDLDLLAKKSEDEDVR